MNSFQRIPFVERRATNASSQLVTQGSRDATEDVRLVVRRQRLQKCGKRW